MKLSPDELRELKIFNDTSHSTLMRLCHTMNLVCYPKGCGVFYEREIQDDVYIVFSGKFVTYNISVANDRRIIFINGAGTMLNDSIRLGASSLICCESFEEATALVVSKREFLCLMGDDFGLALAVTEQFSSKLRKTCRQLKNSLTNVNVEKKIVARLYSLQRDFGVKTSAGVLIDIPLTVTSLSEMIGAQRETISRTMKKLIREDLIVYKNRKILIRDPERIVHFYKKIND